VDTVFDFDSISLEGTGFILKEFSEMSLMGQIARVLELYKNKPLWLRLQQNAMRQDYSWNYSAKEYVKLYLRAIDLHAKPYPKEHSSLS